MASLTFPKTALTVVVHPESVIHSMVAFEDGAVMAELGDPDMRTPIAAALSWPQRVIPAWVLST